MGGDLLGRSTPLGEHRRSASMADDALAERQLVVDRVADERMHERRRSLRLQDLGACQRRHRSRRLLVGDAGERHDVALLAAAEHRERLRNGDGLRSEAVQPHEHGARDRPLTFRSTRLK
jgi:hypothetical protein